MTLPETADTGAAVARKSGGKNRTAYNAGGKTGPTTTATDKHTASPKIRAAARHLIDRGFALCRPDPGKKKPTHRSWPARSLAPEDFQPGDLLGILGGSLSDGNRPGHALVIIDLDAPEAVAQADHFLPATGMEEGRAGKPRSHRYYLVPVESIPHWAVSRAGQAAPAALQAKGHAGPFLKHFRHATTKAGVLDFIGTGGQVVAPSSTPAASCARGSAVSPESRPWRRFKNCGTLPADWP